MAKEVGTVLEVPGVNGGLTLGITHIRKRDKRYHTTAEGCNTAACKCSAMVEIKMKIT